MNWSGLAKAAAFTLYDWWVERRKRAAAQRRWANTPAPVRACPRCREIAFVPGQVCCTKCGAPL